MNNIPTTGELFATNQVSPDTERCYRNQLRHFASWIGTAQGKTEIEDVTLVDLLAYKQTLTHLAPSTQKRYLATLKSFFNWAYESGIIALDPAAGLKLPRVLQGKAPTHLTIEETRDLFEHVPSGRYAKRDRAMLWCLVHGLRVAEVASLNLADVMKPDDEHMPALRVRGKGKKQRTVPLIQPAYDAICEYLNGRVDTVGRNPLLVCTYKGSLVHRMSTRALHKRFAMLAKRAGIAPDKRHPHSARHGYATRMLFEAKVPGGIYTVSRLLGHSRVATTEMYLHASQKKLQEAALADPLAMGVY